MKNQVNSLHWRRNLENSMLSYVKKVLLIDLRHYPQSLNMTRDVKERVILSYSLY